MDNIERLLGIIEGQAEAISHLAEQINSLLTVVVNLRKRIEALEHK